MMKQCNNKLKQRSFRFTFRNYVICLLPMIFEVISILLFKKSIISLYLAYVAILIWLALNRYSTIPLIVIWGIAAIFFIITTYALVFGKW